MTEKHKRLPDAELEVMQIIWRAGEPVAAGEVHKKLRGLRPWALPTVITVLGRLVEKGCLQVDKSGRNHLFTPLITEESYRRGEGKTLLEKLCGNSLRTLVASLYDGKTIGESDLEELREFIDQNMGGDKKC